MRKIILSDKKLLSLCLFGVLTACLIFLSCFNSLLIQKIYAAAEGPQSPTAAGNDIGAGTEAWSNAINITSSDDQRAAVILGKYSISSYLAATGFDFSAIPDGATILGITVEVERSEAGDSIKAGIIDSEIRIIQDGIINTEQNKADADAYWPAEASESYAVYGGADDLWGISWTSDQIKSAGFGVAIAVENVKVFLGGGAETAQIDHVRVTVAYSAEPITDQVHFRWRNDDGGESTGQRLVGIIRPDGDYSAAWETVSPLGSHYTAVDEAIIQPTAGDVSDYISDNAENIDDFNMETVSDSGGSYNRVDVWVYARTVSNERLAVNLIINGIPQSAQRHKLSNSFIWYQTSFTGLSLSQTDLDDLIVRLEQERIGNQSYVDAATMYAEVFEDTSAATFKAAENTIVADQAKSENVRLRLLIKNNGANSTGSENYRLQFAPMAGEDCHGGDEIFADVSAQGSCGASAVCMTDSIYFTDQDYTLNILPGITDPAGAFAAGKLVENLSNQANSLILANNEFTELEYNFEFTANAVSGKDYCFRVNMAGNDLAVYSQIAKITLAGAGYTESGIYISNAFNAGAPSAFNVIEWSESKTNPLCASCNIKLQIKTALDNGGVPGAWSAAWCGPEGDDGDETDYFTVSTGELIHTDHNGGQWIQYKAVLEGDGIDTPILEEISINYK